MKLRYLFGGMIILLVFLCAVSSANNDKPVINFENSAEISVEYKIVGVAENWTITDKVKIKKIAAWWDNLKVKEEHFEVNNLPGNEYGYYYKISNENGLLMDYCVYDNETIYILIDYEWYKVINHVGLEGILAI